MLWDYISRYKAFFSLFFCISFSFINLIWKKSSSISTLFDFNKIIEQSNYFLKSILNSPFYIIERFYEYSDLKEKYNKSLEEIEKYRLQKEQYEKLLKENEKLRNLLNFEQLSNYKEVKAEILGIRLNSITPRIIINKGKSHGIKPFMPVLSFTTDENNHPIRAVVGITAMVQNTNSVVQPIQHPQMKLGVKIESSNQWAILEGNSFSFNALKLKYLTSSSNINNRYFSDSYIEIHNSRVITSGNDGIFPPNILVGKIIDKGYMDEDNFAVAYLKPYIELDKLEFVIILLKEPESWSDFVRNDNEFQEMNNLLTTDYVPEELLKNHQEQSINIQKKVIKHNNTEKEKIQKEENVKMQEDKNKIDKKIDKIINPNDPFQ